MNVATLIESRASSDIISITVDHKVRDAVRLLAEKRIGAVPVMSEGNVAGIFSERDVIYRLAQEGDACLDQQVGMVMTSPAITIDVQTPILKALSLMTKRRFRHFPVVDGETLVAFISIGDLVKYKIDEVEHEAAALRDYIKM